MLWFLYVVIFRVAVFPLFKKEQCSEFTTPPNFVLDIWVNKKGGLAMEKEVECPSFRTADVTTLQKWGALI